MFGLSNIATRLIAGMAAVILIGIAFFIYGERREDSGYARCEADWQASAIKAQQDNQRAIDKADAAAIERETALQNQVEGLRDEARKGTDDRVGPGVAGVLERMRQQQTRR